MACPYSSSVSFFNSSFLPNKSSLTSTTSLNQLSFSKTNSFINSNNSLSLFHFRSSPSPSPNTPNFLVVRSAAKKREPLKIMISGAPASGKGTQCELITKKYDLMHIAAGDLLTAAIAAGSDNGKRAKEYMEIGQLVPGEIIVTIVKERLMQPDSQDKGWLLDGYPRSLSQATALEGFGFHQISSFFLKSLRRS